MDAGAFALLLFQLRNHFHHIVLGAALGGSLLLALNTRLHVQWIGRAGAILLLAGSLGGFVLFSLQDPNRSASRATIDLSPYSLSAYNSD